MEDRVAQTEAAQQEITEAHTRLAAKKQVLESRATQAEIARQSLGNEQAQLVAEKQTLDARVIQAEAVIRSLVESVTQFTADKQLIEERAAQAVAVRREFEVAQMKLLGRQEAAATEIARLNALLADAEQRLKEFRLPSILITSIPRSGAMFTNLALNRGLGLESAIVSFGYFPEYLVELPKLMSFKKDRKLVQAHFDVSPVNLQLLANVVKKWIVHVRDQRSVLLSWCTTRTTSTSTSPPAPISICLSIPNRQPGIIKCRSQIRLTGASRIFC